MHAANNNAKNHIIDRVEDCVKDRHVQVLSLIVLLGLVLRLYHLGVESIWQDEGFSIHYAGLSLADIAGQLPQIDLNPPLHIILLHYWMMLFGQSEVVVRLLSALFGAGAIIAIYLVATRLFKRAVGLLSASFLALSPFMVYYSQEARGYSLLVLLTLLSFYFFLRLLEKPTRGVIAGYTVASVLLLYVHLFGIFLVIAQSLYYISVRFLVKPAARGLNERSLKIWLLTQAALLILYVPWLWVLYSRLSLLAANKVGLGAWSIQKPTLMSLVDMVSSFSGGAFAALILVGLSIVAIVDIFENKSADARADKTMGDKVHHVIATADKNFHDSRRSLLFVLLWLLVTVVIAFFVSLVAVPMFAAKYMIGAVPALFMIAARGVAALENRYAKAAAIAIVVVISVVVLWGYYGDTVKEPWRDAVQAVESQAQPGDVVVFNIGACRFNCFDYYAKRTDITNISFPQDAITVDDTALCSVLPQLKGHGRIWFVFLGMPQNLDAPRRALSSGYTVAYRHIFTAKQMYPINVYLFESR
jgi:4-amino-4-deoxy-L-arabinose transferase-like glycosyltransferase